jgi:integrase
MTTAQSYLFALRSHHIDLGLSVQSFDDERLKRIIRGAKRQFGETPTRERKEITKEVLQSLVSHLTHTHDDVNLQAAFCVAFAAFLRVDEFTWKDWTSQSHLFRLSRGSIRFADDGHSVTIQLPSSKTDQFRHGVMIPLSASHDLTCPVVALRILVHRYPKPPTHPLFSRTIGNFTSKWVIQRLQTLLRKTGINPTGFSGHSFHRGAVNSALSAGISRSDIQKMGRWKSDAVDRYFSTTSNTKNLLQLSRQLHSQPGPSIPIATRIDLPCSSLHPSYPGNR